MRIISYLYIVFFCLFLIQCTHDNRDYPRRAEVLFFESADSSDALGASGKYASWLAIELFKSGINLTYTTDAADLNEKNLRLYDGLVLFTVPDAILSGQESALAGFVDGGKGLIVLGAQPSGTSPAWFAKTLEGGTPVTDTLATDLAHRLNKGKGRVFYTEHGSDESTWKNLDFLRSINKGVQWAIGDRVMGLVAQLKIPSVSIYEDTIADFTARHFVPKMQEPLSPEESAKLIQVPVGFELKLFASEPDIVNPIAMSWDEKGRLWIIETVDYPNNFVELKGEANDRIKICEDTDGDGVADKFTVFADRLNIATSLTFANDGVIVAMAPHFIFMKDTDGDNVVDVRDTIMTGWNKNDTHAGPSNLQYGFDNKIWGVTGYAGFNGHINGKRLAFGQGVYRFRPDGTDFEYLATTSNNTWGLGMTEDNNVFISTANNTHSAYYSMPEQLVQRQFKEDDQRPAINAVQKIDGHYDVHAMTPNLRQVDVVGGFTSAAGHQLYTARDYPQTYWNKVAFVTEPTVRLIHNAVIEPDGAGFKEHDGWNLAASSDEWFGPIHAEVGPDGAVWILDWYNFIIQHNVFVPAQAPSDKVLPFIEQPHGPGNAFESDLRDKKYGRVYRLVYTDAKHKTSHKLSKDDTGGLLKALKSDNKFWRMHAQRLLVERQQDDVADELIRIASDQKVDKIGLNAPAIHALWTLQGLNLIAERQDVFDAVVKGFKHPSAGVRKATAQALPVDDRSRDALLNSGILADTNLNTRMAAFVKLAEYPASEAVAKALLEATGDPANENDRWLSQALFAAIARHEDAFFKLASTRTTGNFARRILESLANEQYTLGRRSRFPFSPDVSNKKIHIQTEVRRRDNQPYNGLIVGQGDKTAGYALYTKNNRLFFEVYQHGQTATVSSRGNLPSEFVADARVTVDASIELSINGTSQGKAKIMHLFAEPLALNLRSGEDFDETYAFTDYGGASGFTGNINNTVVRLSKAHQSAAFAHGGAAMVADPKSSVPSERIELKAVKDIMQYDKKLITVPAGKRITLVFENPDGMQHNLLIIQPGTLDIVGKAADDMLRSSEAFERQYVPAIPEVLHHTPLVNPGESFTLEFTAPEQPGDYTYVCTFPGHWRGMNGTMRVVR
ncbi:PVC-type heme-binding CxxCH protein [Parapedobacter koreensis]|uniref:Putative membrane-bound dehydrogenase domain-containing protein n=1 Tax=Parapedobacter koreensis TaxID=332977 RepID=A0A1H7RLU9_9SPHI|nr:PVC-type heme-binding CxxCH protein [Parapedobacter koreensis]SEL61115.1 putative membrane-bound dehydrogenase domain-containing protein [Parapedobacter koreensis]